MKHLGCITLSVISHFLMGKLPSGSGDGIRSGVLYTSSENLIWSHQFYREHVDTAELFASFRVSVVCVARG